MMHGWEHGLSARVPAKAYGQGVLMRRQCSPSCVRQAPRRSNAPITLARTSSPPTPTQHKHNYKSTFTPLPTCPLQRHASKTLGGEPFHRLTSMKNQYIQNPRRLTRTPPAHPRTPCTPPAHSTRPPSHTLHAPRALHPPTLAHPARPPRTPPAHPPPTLAHPTRPPRALPPHTPAHSPRTPPARPRALTPARPRTPPARALPAHPRAPTPLAHAKPHPMLCAINVLPTAYQKCWMLPP